MIWKPVLKPSNERIVKTLKFSGGEAICQEFIANYWQKFPNNLLDASQGTPIVNMAIFGEYVANDGMYHLNPTPTKTAFF